MLIRYILFLCLFSITSTAQPKIEGIGKFKIGKTSINITQEVAQELGGGIKLVSTAQQVYDSDSPRIIELATNTDNGEDRHDYAPYCKKLRVFFINDYTIAGVPLHGVYLTFMNDLLIRFYSENSPQIAEVFNLKYGKPKPVFTTRKITCTLMSTKEPVNTQGKAASYKWTSGTIQATYTHEDYFDYECNQQTFDPFELGDTTLMAVANKCNEAAKQVGKGLTPQQLKDF